MGDFPAHFDLFREAVFSCENAGGMGAGPCGPHYAFLITPGWVQIFKATIMRNAAVTTLADSAKTYLRPVR